MKKVFSVLAVTALAASLASCGTSTIQIGVVLPDASEERWANQDGKFFEQELAKLGSGYAHQILFSEGDEAKEKQNVESLIARGAKVIIITVEGSGAGAVEAAKAAGVQLIAHDRLAKKDLNTIANYYTTFNSWNVGKAMGAHLVEMAKKEGATSSNKADLALFAGRVADYPNATYFFGGAWEEIQPNLSLFNIINVNDTFSTVARYTEATFNDTAKNALQAAMLPVDTDWNPDTAAVRAAAVVSKLGTTDKSGRSVFVLAPNDDTSAAIRQEFAKMPKPYAKYFTTGQDASDTALYSLMGDTVRGKGTQTMTVFKDTSKLVANSVLIAKNIIDGRTGLTGLTGGPKIDGVETAYTAIDVLTVDNKQQTYDLIFKTGYKLESNFVGLNFAPYK